EPFETLQHKIAAVAALCFEQDVSSIRVEHMKGGSYNRVAALTISPRPKRTRLTWFHALLQTLFPSWYQGALQTSESPDSKSYIIRILRFEGEDEDFGVNRDVAILKTVGALLDLPIPTVVSYDPTSNNAMGKPYMIQSRLPGKNLAALMNEKTLNIEQLKCIAKRVTELVPKIAAVEGPGGAIPLNALSSDSTQLQVESLHLQHDKLGDKLFRLPDEPQDTYEHLLEQCRRWSEYHRENSYFTFGEIWCNFGRIVQSLDERGFLEGPCVLAHRDLMAYNLLAEVRSNTDVEITGVIDWDSALMVPEFVAYRAPFWLWTEDHIASDIADDEIMVNTSPHSETCKILKQVFLDNASEKFKRFAFSPEAMLARRMYVIIKEGIASDWYMDEAWDIVRDWHLLHPDDGIQLPE
ncbi:hypothetical protein COCMIDRAFT_51989, partial [Bipolaris oryzae ATCC 44560]